jgi:hypothetical protein
MGPTGGEGYVRQKFPGLDFKEVLNTLSEYKNITTRFHRVKVREVPGIKNCFWIYKE